MKRTVPGSIFARRGKIYISFKNKQYSTGLTDTKIGRRLAEDILEDIYKKSNDINTVHAEKIPMIAEAFEKFLTDKVNYFEKTRRTHLNAYNAIIRFNHLLSQSEIKTDVLYYLNNTTHNPVTINTYLTYLNVFLNYCTNEGWMPKINLKKNYAQKENRIEPDPWTDSECKLFLEYFKSKRPEFALLIEFMIETGARVVDALTLTPERVKDSTIIWSNKKTKTPEERPISSRTVEILNTLQKRPDRIFKWSYKSSSRLYRYLKDAAKDLNIEMKERGFQEFRSYFRMQLLRKGVPVEYVIYLMRHKTIDTTRVFYTQFRNDIIQKFLDLQ